MISFKIYYYYYYSIKIFLRMELLTYYYHSIKFKKKLYSFVATFLVTICVVYYREPDIFHDFVTKERHTHISNTTYVVI